LKYFLANCAVLKVPCFKAITYISWIFKRDSRAFASGRPPSPSTSPAMVELPGIAQEFLFMILMGLVYMIVLMIVEYNIPQKIFAKISQSSKTVFADNVNDEDVLLEAVRVTEMVKNGKQNLVIYSKRQAQTHKQTDMQIACANL